MEDEVNLLEAGTSKHHDYVSYLQRCKSMLPQLPQMQLAYNNLSHEVRDSDFQIKKVLDNVSGLLTPRSMTLVMAPSGHGRSTFLRTLAGQVSDYSGQVTYNGLSLAELQDKGINLQKLGCYVDQSDVFFSDLTLRETLQFQNRHTVRPLDRLEASKQEQQAQMQVNMVIKMLGLEKCADRTINLLSGGERRRTGLAEALVGPYRMFFLDEITSGLDTTTAIEVLTSLHTWCTEMDGLIVAALLQPPMEVYRQFDHLILLREGRVVYDGPTSEVMNYIKESFGVSCPSDITEPEFLLEFLAGSSIHPRQVVGETKEEVKERQATPHHVSIAAAITTDQMVSKYQDSKFCRALSTQPQEPSGVEGGAKWFDALLADEHLEAQYAQPFSRSYLQHFRACCHSQFLQQTRTTRSFWMRFARNVVIGLVMGLIFWQMNTTNQRLFLGALLFYLATLAFNNTPFIPITLASKNILLRHKAQSVYPMSCYLLAQQVTFIPTFATEVIVSAFLLYWMLGLSAYFTQFVIFIALLSGFVFYCANWFRFVAFACTSFVTAMLLINLSMFLCITFSGVLIHPSEMASFWTFAFYLSPFCWMIWAIAVNEYTSGRYSMSEAQLLLDEWNIPDNMSVIWIAMIAMVGLGLMSVVLSHLALTLSAVPFSRGAKSQRTEMNDSGNNEAAQTSFTVPPVTITFRDLSYDVPNLANPGSPPLRILENIHGHFEPGSLTALMGETGAGKTTLLDCLAGRPKVGVISGFLSFNGNTDRTKIRGLVAYVEQMDVHCPFATAREALNFAYELRHTDYDIPKEQRIGEILSTLELEHVADVMIGGAGGGAWNEGGVQTLSVQHQRLLSVGVELTANPAVLFLDEPTTGLDSRIAFVVIRMLRRLAASGRTVICTIHQPSPNLFLQFDRLLLLHGGKQMYFGEIGPQAQHMVTYFQKTCSAPISTDAPEGSLPSHVNPATWVMNLVAARDGTSTVDHGACYKGSALAKDNLAFIESHENSIPAEAAGAQKELRERGFWKQAYVLTERLFWSYVRHPTFLWKARLLFTCLVGFVWGGIYYKFEVETAHEVVSKINIMFLVLQVVVNQHALTLPFYLAERSLYLKERLTQSYGALAYTFSSFILELFWMFIATAIGIPVFYFMVGFTETPAAFWGFFLAFFLLMVLFASTGQLFTIVFATPEMAGIGTSVFLACCYLFSGVYVPGGDISMYFRWLYYINPIQLAIHAMAEAEFNCPAGQAGMDCGTVVVDTLQITKYEYVHEYFGVDVGGYWGPIGCLIAMIVGVKLVSAWYYHNTNPPSR